MAGEEGRRSLKIAYLCTTFPVLTETFLQREVIAMRKLGVDLDIFSLHRGSVSFEGIPIRRFSKWQLVRLLWRLPVEWLRQPGVCWRHLHRLLTKEPPSLLNFGENMLGIGFALVSANQFRRSQPDVFHAVWASLPGMAAWLLSDLTGIPFTTGAHAFDIFEHGGDWFIREKLAAAALIHTSTNIARDRILELSPGNDRVQVIRRGLNHLPSVRKGRSLAPGIAIICVARLVEKKGFVEQLAIYAALRDAGIAFTARIIGTGPLAERLRGEIRRLRLSERVTLAGALPSREIWNELAGADVLFHTGRVAPNGDRDGLPNVIPEAMAAGVVVVTSSGGGPMEAITHEKTGLVCELETPRAWVETMQRLQSDPDLTTRLQVEARRWVEENFDARANAARLLDRWRRVVELSGTDA